MSFELSFNSIFTGKDLKREKKNTKKIVYKTLEGNALDGLILELFNMKFRCCAFKHDDIYAL